MNTLLRAVKGVLSYWPKLEVSESYHYGIYECYR